MNWCVELDPLTGVVKGLYNQALHLRTLVFQLVTIFTLGYNFWLFNRYSDWATCPVNLVFMSPLIHLLTVAAIFMHSVLGCCAHEARRVVSEASVCQSSLRHTEHGHTEHGHGHDDLSQESQQHEPHAGCHADCKWPAPEARNTADLVLLNFAGILPSTSTISPVLVLANGLNSPGLLPELSLHTLPVRSHLAHGVLLI